MRHSSDVCDGCHHVCDFDALGDTVEIEDADVDTEELDQFIYQADMELGVNKPRFNLYLLPTDLDGDGTSDGSYSIRIEYQKYNPSTCKFETETLAAALQTATKTVKIGDKDVALLKYRITVPNICYMSQLLNITVTFKHTDTAKGNIVVAGTYSVGAYIAETENVAPAKALYAFSEAALKYKEVTALEKRTQQ